MKLISCVIRPERLPAVKEALFRAGVTGITITRASGHGGERDTVTVRRGTKLLLQFHEKVKIEMACSEPFVEATISAIITAARTGAVGDGTGLGLFLSREIVVSHGGSLTIDSVLGKGTMVVIALPNHLRPMTDGIAGA